MAYTKTIETKVIRAKHKVDFRKGTSAEDLVCWLQNVPRTAKVVDMYDTYTDGGATNISSIEFIEEKEEEEE